MGKAELKDVATNTARVCVEQIHGDRQFVGVSLPIITPCVCVREAGVECVGLCVCVRTKKRAVSNVTMFIDLIVAL